MYRTGLNHSKILERDMATLNLDMSLPTSIEQCKEWLRESNLEINKLVAESYQRRDQERDARIQELEQALSTVNKNNANCSGA